MIKMVTLLKRRPGMSMEEFIAYYESKHRLIGEKYMRGYASRYVRRYLEPLPDPTTGERHEPEHDVLMEIWFPDQAAFDAAMAGVTQPGPAKEIADDEARVFDRAKLRSFIVTEYESEV